MGGSNQVVAAAARSGCAQFKDWWENMHSSKVAVAAREQVKARGTEDVHKAAQAEWYMHVVHSQRRPSPV
jgi:hypothetical protein